MKHESFESRVLNYLSSVKYIQPLGKYGNKLARLRAYEHVRYEDYDLRGLSNIEKQFVRDNEMRNYVDVKGYTGKINRMYLLVIKDNLGRKRLMAYDKRQWIDPNGDYFHLFSKDKVFNYDKLLVFNPNSVPFSLTHFECRKFGCAFVLGF